jgi:hypothetical protein
MAICISTAQATARRALSPAPEKIAMIESPANLSMAPSWRTMASLIAAKQRLRSSSTLPAGCAAASEVKPRRSANMMVTSRSEKFSAVLAPEGSPASALNALPTRLRACASSALPVASSTTSSMRRSASRTDDSLMRPLWGAG